jgi:hypothetical protein
MPVTLQLQALGAPRYGRDGKQAPQARKREESRSKKPDALFRAGVEAFTR